MTSDTPSPRRGLADRLMSLIWRRPATEVGERARRRVVVYLIPYLFFLYILAYLDRVNVSVAGLGMKESIGEGGLAFTRSVLGFGAGFFFWGYWILEVPSTLSVLKWGARWVFVRILILWGLSCTLIGMIGTPFADSMFGWLNAPAMDPVFDGLKRITGWLSAHLFDVDAGDVSDPNVRQFYFLRFMLGFFEGGFFPSVILYLSLWFRPRDRARAIATFMAAIPVSSLLGSPLSGLMLQINWGDMPGWRWIFILQGIAPILAGFVTIFFLPDRPEKAPWLKEDERDFLVGELHREHLSKKTHGHWVWVGSAGTVLLLTAYYFCMNVTSYGLSIFMPSIIKQQSGLSSTWAGVIAGLPYLMGLVAMLVNGWHSDRSGERIWHVATPLVCLSGSIYLAAVLDGMWIWPVFVMIFLVGTFMYAHLPAFWPIPTMFLGAAAAASAIGFINMIGNLGGFVGPAMVGKVSEGETTFAPALMTLVRFPLIAAGIILFVGYLRRAMLSRSQESSSPSAEKPGAG